MTTREQNRTTYETSLKTDSLDLQFGGFTGNGVTPSVLPNTVVATQFPSVATLRAQYALGNLTQAQFAQLMTATAMACQAADRVARDTLVGTGDTGPA